PNRLARHAVEHVDESLLARLRDDVDVATVMPEGEQLRRLREVVIPQIVMDGLEVPQPLARPRIEGDDAVAEQVVADAVAAVEVEPRGAKRDVRDAARVVDRQLAPVVDAAAGRER